ncbi:hypothetical protein LXL04_019612 [Taraxacum kok-saghyz]
MAEPVLHNGRLVISVIVMCHLRGSYHVPVAAVHVDTDPTNTTIYFGNLDIAEEELRSVALGENIIVGPQTQTSDHGLGPESGCLVIEFHVRLGPSLGLTHQTESREKYHRLILIPVSLLLPYTKPSPPPSPNRRTSGISRVSLPSPASASHLRHLQVLISDFMQVLDDGVYFQPSICDRKVRTMFGFRCPKKAERACGKEFVVERYWVCEEEYCQHLSSLMNRK